MTLADISPLSIQLKYKKQISDKMYFKLGLINLSYNYSTNYNESSSFPIDNEAYSAGIQIGLEFRKKLTNTFSFFHGPNIEYVYSNNTEINLNPSTPVYKNKRITQNHIGQIPYTLGVLFNLNIHVLFAAEINPGIQFNFKESYYTGEYTDYKHSFSSSLKFDNRLCLLSLVYRL